MNGQHSSLEPQEQAWHDLYSQIVLCRRCPRLVAWREEVAHKKRRAYREWEYWGRPITGFGDRQARILVVGLAPGAHGSNRTGRVFSGDDSGSFLFPSLYRTGFANQPNATHRGDGLVLRDLYISAVARCVPPDNRPLPVEMDNCQEYLEREMALLPPLIGIVVLGQIAFDRVLRMYRQRGFAIPALKFGHGFHYDFDTGMPWLLASYHPSRQNTQTGRLTPTMFDQIWLAARSRLGKAASGWPLANEPGS